MRDLDNQDKHHVQVTPAINPAMLQHQMGVTFETEAGAIASTPPRVEIFTPPFEDGALLFRWHANGRIEKVAGSAFFGAQIQVQDPGSGWIGLTESLAVLCYYTRLVLQYVIDEGATPTASAAPPAPPS